MNARYDRDHMPTPKSSIDWPALIRSQPALAKIPLRLRNAAEQLPIAAGQTLCRIGDPVRNMFSVVAGEVRLLRRARHGGEIILQRSRGGFIAEASLAARFYHCDVVAAETGALLCFSAQVFREALHENADFREAWMTLLAREVRKLRAHCERLSLHGAAERIVHYIEAEGSDGVLTLGQSRKSWANELGLTHEAVYRTLRRMQRDGTLSIVEDRIALGVGGK